MASDAGDSVTRWLGPLKQGEHHPVQPLWERYFDRLIRLARTKLAGAQGLGASEEDVALSAFDSFCRAAAAGRFPSLDDRQDLWRILMTLTARKAVNLRKHAARLKRGGGRVLDEASLVDSALGDGQRDLEAFVGREPSPEFAAMLADELQTRLEALEDPSLRQVAIWKMEGLTSEEIAERMHCVPLTVTNKLKLIRFKWEGDR